MLTIKIISPNKTTIMQADKFTSVSCTKEDGEKISTDVNAPTDMLILDNDNPIFIDSLSDVYVTNEHNHTIFTIRR